MGCLHDQANVQQTSSKCNAGRLLDREYTLLFAHSASIQNKTKRALGERRTPPTLCQSFRRVRQMFSTEIQSSLSWAKSNDNLYSPTQCGRKQNKNI